MEKIIIKELQVGGRKYFAMPQLEFTPTLDNGLLCIEDPSLNLIVSATSHKYLTMEIEAELRFLIKEYLWSNVESLAEDALLFRNNLASRFPKWI